VHDDAGATNLFCLRVEGDHASSKSVIKVFGYNLLYENTTMFVVSQKQTKQEQRATMDASSPKYKASLSSRFLLGAVLLTCIFSCGLGILARNVIIERALASVTNDRVAVSKDRPREFLPSPTVSADKVVPPTIYTTMNFDTRSSVFSSQWLQNDKKTLQQPDEVFKAPENAKLVLIKNGTDYEYDADEEEHLPAGQHLLIDIDGVDGSFLNSEKQLATAMLEMVDNSGLTLLSYHCHGLQPSGVTCVGVLLESHVSFHTWPTEGVITLDLFTCGATSLLNHLQLIQGLFAVPSRGERNPETPQVIWAYKRRGFNEQTGSAGSRDTFAYPLGIHGIEKEEVSC
jgi:S-adenosylmethionine decarboxylase proenzyme